MKNSYRLLSLLIGYTMLYGPLFLVTMFSFNSSRSVKIWTGFSTQWYKALIENQWIRESLFTSLLVGACTATISVALGTFAAVLLSRFLTKTKKYFFSAIITAPIITPDVVTGISLAIFFSYLSNIFGWPRNHGYSSIILAHVAITVSYTTLMIQAKLADVDKTLEEAAMNLGATPFQSFFVITLPLISRSMILAWMLAFVLSIDDIVVSNFVAGPDVTTLSMLIFSSIRTGISPEINALSSVVLAILLSFACSAAWISHKHAQNNHHHSENDTKHQT